MAVSQGQVDEQHPWPGLLSFAEQDRDFFFGRDDEVEELLALIANNRLTILYGASGLGKSSLLRAGLFPRLRERHYLPVFVRLDLTTGAATPSTQLKSALAATLRQAAADAPPMNDSDSIWEYLHRIDTELWSARHRILTPVFVLDQFEEMFSRLGRDAAGDNVRQAIIETVGDLSEGRVPETLKRSLEAHPQLADAFDFADHRYRVLIGVREDYLADLDELSSEIASLRQSRMRLTHMRGSKAIAAIRAAARRADILPSHVAFEIVRFVGRSTATATDQTSLKALPIEPALLSVVCFELNEERLRDERDQIAAEQLQKSDAILTRFYADAMEDSPEALVRFVEDHLITAEGVREMATYERLGALDGVREDDIARLIDRRVLRIEHRHGRRLIELTHDLLAPVVRASRDRRRQQDVAPSGAEDLRHLATLLEGLRALGSGRVLDEVLALVVDAAIDVSEAERGFVMLTAPRDGQLEFKIARGRGRTTLPGSSFTTSRKIPEEVVRTGQPRFIADLLDMDLADSGAGTVALGIRHVACVPLRLVRYVDRADQIDEARCIGVLYLDSREQRVLSQPTRAALETLATEAAVAIENARLYRETTEKLRMEQEMQIAAEIQAALMPNQVGGGDYYELSAASVPCRAIGGDFFHHDTSQPGVSLLIGDVAGKGAAAALLSAMVIGIFKGLAAPGADAATTVGHANRAVVRAGVQSRFVTLFLATLHPDGVLEYCNAGHSPPLVFSATTVNRLATGGAIVGLFEAMTYEQDRVQLAPGDLVVMFTDGVSEALNADGEEFGEDRIIQSVRAASSDDPSAVVDTLMSSIRAFAADAAQADDITVMVVKYTG